MPRYRLSVQCTPPSTQNPTHGYIIIHHVTTRGRAAGALRLSAPQTSTPTLRADPPTQHWSLIYPDSEKMRDIEDYELIFPHGSYTEALRSDIQESQSTLGGRTFFERLLELLNVKCESRELPRLAIA